MKRLCILITILFLFSIPSAFAGPYFSGGGTGGAGVGVYTVGTLPSAEVIWEPIINQGLVRFLSPKLNATDADHDRRTDSVIADVLESGEAFFTGTTWKGKRCMRVSVCNWKTDDMDVERAINAVEIALTKQ